MIGRNSNRYFLLLVSFSRVSFFRCNALLSAATEKTTAAAKSLRKSQPILQRSEGLATLAAVTNQTNRTLYSTFLLSLH